VHLLVGEEMLLADLGERGGPFRAVPPPAGSLRVGEACDQDPFGLVGRGGDGSW